MEIKISVPENTYVIPTEVRQDVVQDICSHIIKWMRDGSYEISYSESSCKLPEIYLFRRTDGSTSGIASYNDGRQEQAGGEAIKVRSVEMKAVFEAMQNAGYYIYAWYVTDGTHRYNFNIRPHFYGMDAKRIDFDGFID